MEANQPLPELGTSPALLDNIFRLRVGDLSAPMRTDRGYVVVSVRIFNRRIPPTLAEVHDRVAGDYRHEKAVELAKTRAEELAKRVKSGENFAAAAKALGFEVKTSEPFPRTGSIPDAGSAKQFSAAFTYAGRPDRAIRSPWEPIGSSIASPSTIPSIQDDFEKQKTKIEAQVLQEKRQTAYELFRTALKTRLQQEGKLRVNQDNLKRLTTPA